jgi:very-short-patch-repair endonuclease
VIEIDGGIHNKSEVKERDENRMAELERLGIKVLRFTNNQVLCNIEEVMVKIEEALSSSPSPPGEGAGG